MDRLDKVVSMVCEYNATCGGRIECKGCKYYDRKCNLKYLMDTLMEWDKTIPKESCIQLKNVDMNEVTLEQQVSKILEGRSELFDALNKFNKLKEDKDAKEHVIEKLCSNIQALLGLVQKYGITAEEVAERYPEHLNKMEQKVNK